MKTVVIAPSWIGDMVMAQSLLKKLKELDPSCFVGVAAPGWCLPLLSRMPEVDEAIKSPFAHGELAIGKRGTFGKELAEKGYELAIVLPNSFKSALAPFLGGIKKRRGWIGEQRYIVLNERLKGKDKFPRMVSRYVALAFDPAITKIASPDDIGQISRPSLVVDKAAGLEAAERCGANIRGKILGMCPGAEYGPAKRWPTEYFAKVADHWIKNGGCVMTFGSKKDTQAAEAIIAASSPDAKQFITDMTGKTELTEAIDLLGSCAAVVTNDSGLMHVSAAVGTPLVAVYGSSSTQYTPPLSEKAACVWTNEKCRPCFKRNCPLGTTACLNELKPERVIKELDSLLQKFGDAR